MIIEQLKQEESLNESCNSRRGIRDLELAKLVAIWMWGLRKSVKSEMISRFLARKTLETY